MILNFESGVVHLAEFKAFQNNCNFRYNEFKWNDTDSSGTTITPTVLLSPEGKT